MQIVFVLKIISEINTPIPPPKKIREQNRTKNKEKPNKSKKKTRKNKRKKNPNWKK